MNDPPCCSKSADVHTPTLQSEACMAKFKERVKEHLIRLKSSDLQEEIQHKVKTKIASKVTHEMEEMKNTMKKKLIAKFSEIGLFEKTQDTQCQTIEDDGVSERPSDEFILTSQMDDVIRLDISDTHQWEVRSQEDSDEPIPSTSAPTA